MHKLFSATFFAAFTLASASAALAQVAVPGGPDIPEPAPSTYSCTDELGYLRRVHASELAPVKDPTQVWVTPICENEDSAFRTVGNAGKLRTAIAANQAMEAALEDKAFGPDDVVGVRMTGPDTVILYVLPFHR
jgi:hypothetical protein